MLWQSSMPLWCLPTCSSLQYSRVSGRVLGQWPVASTKAFLRLIQRVRYSGTGILKYEHWEGSIFCRSQSPKVTKATRFSGGPRRPSLHIHS
uniref:Putative secreted protein n=1 Tax=Ixodes ricinus TaxID=34613 RepID=A0A6B0U1R8_IXORI